MSKASNGFKNAIKIISLILVVLVAYNWQRINRLYSVVTLFDQDKIVSNFSNMGEVFLTLPIKQAGEVFAFNRSPKKLPSNFSYQGKETSVDEFLKRRATTALLVLKNDAISFEEYYLETKDTDQRISWSMAKSFVSILFGMQVDAGKIDIEKNVGFYLDEMKGSGYENVKVKHVLQMSSGVKWDENYHDFNSDINKMGRLLAIGGSLDNMTTKLQTEQEAGKAFHYVSMDTHVLGMIVRRVSGRSLIELLQEKIWNRLGMEGGAEWITDSHHAAFALGGLNVRTRDYARFGRLMLNNGHWQGEQIVSADWIKQATTAGSDYLKPGDNTLGYGYQIWLPPRATPGEFFFVGVYGQFTYINQAANVVIIKNSADLNFSESYGSKQETIEFFRAIVDSLDGRKLSKATSSSESAAIVNQLDQLYLDYEKDNLELNPINAIFRGNMDYNDQFGDYLSDEYFAKSIAQDKHYLKRLVAIDPTSLTGSDRISFDIFKYNREQSIKSSENGSDSFFAMMPINQMFSWATYLPVIGSGSSAQPFKTVKNYEDWIKRAKGFDAYAKQAILRMKQGVENGVVMPTILMEKTLPQLKAQILLDIEKSPFYMPITKLPETFSDADKKRLASEYKKLIKDNLMVTYQSLSDYIENDYMKHTRETHGIGALPNGKVAYNQSIKQMTTTEMQADEIHELGLKEAKRLFNEMKKVRDAVGFEGDMQSFFTFLKTDPQFYYDDVESLMQGYEDLRAVIDPKLDSIFNIQPKTNYIIKAVESFRERSAAPAQYSSGATDGSRPGTFYVNTYDLSARPKWMMSALSIHEASPGHHFQISLNREAGELPPFRRFGGYSAYSEGWGLYSEVIGKEMGLYEDPYQYFGMLHAQIWRANRLVVDTGIHAKGWTREQAIDFMTSNSPIAESDVIAEVERYMAMPGQALSYMIGSMKIQELRQRATEKLGEQFDIREFHREILADGAMPLAILEQKIDRWIKTANNTNH